MSAANYAFNVSSTTGATTSTFSIGAEQLTRGLDARLLGACVPPAGTGGPAPDCALFNGGPTTVTIVYRTVIQDNFTNTYPSGDPSVDEGDVLGNSVTAAAELLAVNDGTTPNGNSQTDTSGASVTIASGTFTKSVYAVNGNTAFGNPVLTAGDTVTFRLTVTLPSSDFEPLTITDYLPLPVMLSTEQSGTFDATVSAAPPPAGQAKFGPGETLFALSGLAPNLAIDPVGNTVAFEYPAFDDPANTFTSIDILFTETITSTPVADGLVATNLARLRIGTTDAGVAIVDTIIGGRLNQPNLRLSKGVIAASSPLARFTPPTVGPVAFSPPGSLGFRGSAAITSTGLATPIDSDAALVDAADVVSFAIVLENIGRGPNGAFDVTLTDTIPAGFVPPASLAALNLSVTNGNGAALAFTDLGGGPFGGGGGLFGTGLRLDDGVIGSLTSVDDTSGTNIAVITYDLALLGTVPASRVLVNTATLTNYANVEGGPDFTQPDLPDIAQVTTTTPTVTKTITATNQAHTAANDVVIGELVTYQISIRVPEGTTPAATLLDTLDTGLAVVNPVALVASPSVTASAGSFPAILAAAAIPAGPSGGGSLSLNFGTLTNTDTNDATNETVVLTYSVVVLNTTGNNSGTRNNNALLSFTGGTATAAAPNVTIRHPGLTITKAASPVSGDAGNPVTFTVGVRSTTTTAFDVVVTDVLPAGLTYVSATYVSGPVPTTFTPGNGFTASWATMPVSATPTTFTIQAVIDPGLTTGTVLTNTASGTWTSLPGVVAAPQSPYHTLSVERTGNTADPGGTANNYRASRPATVTISTASVTKVVADTNQPHTVDPAVAIGEIVTYTVTVVVPEAVSPNVTLVDTLDPGLAFVDFLSLDVTGTSVTTTAPAASPGFWPIAW